MRRDSGLVLLTALLLLAFLTVVGSVFLARAGLDVKISENLDAEVRLGFLGDAGIEEGRELLRVSADVLASRLRTAAGPDGRLAASGTWAAWLGSDDVALLPSGVVSPRGSGEVYPGPAGVSGGTLRVLLGNDLQDGPAEVDDSNGVATLVSLAQVGERMRRSEADLARREPVLGAALTLIGFPEPVDLATAGRVRFDGGDICGGAARAGVGTPGELARDAFVGAIPAARVAAYTGAGPLPAVSDLKGFLPGDHTSVRGLERLVARLRSSPGATVPETGGPVTIGGIGSRARPSIVVVDGNAALGPGVGYGILVVRGEARVRDGFVWNGPVLVVGRGALVWEGPSEVRGGVLVARTRDDPTPEAPLGPERAEPGPVRVDFSGGDGAVRYDSCALEDAYRSLPWSPIAFRNY